MTEGQGHILRGGTLVDGTGGPAYAADIAIAGDRIEAIGQIPADDRPVIDISGLVACPGFIDPHTHYDAQLLWDRDVTPSCWHGVTTVIAGNCGFGLVPLRSQDRRTLMQVLENAEGMPLEALMVGTEGFDGGFQEYLDIFEKDAPRLNVGFMLGHSPLRMYVMGQRISDAPSAADLGEMRALLADALSLGAFGFSTSVSDKHFGAEGCPVPSWFASRDELTYVAAAMDEAGHGILEITPGPNLPPEELPRLANDIQRPVTYAALLTGRGVRGDAMRLLEQIDAQAGTVWPQIACRPIVMAISLEDPMDLSQLASFAEILRTLRGDRRDLCADPAWRSRARVDADRYLGDRWSRVSVSEAPSRPELVGHGLPEIAARLDSTPFDVLVDLALEGWPHVRYRIVVQNDDDVELRQLLRDRRTLLGLSDAGAHSSQLCDAGYATTLLGRWVRCEGALSIEEAIWRLTGHPTSVFDVVDRGLIREGAFADITIFDPLTVDTGPLERVADLPSGADRLVARSTGIETIFVNGVPIREKGIDVDFDGVDGRATSRPGRVLRGREVGRRNGIPTPAAHDVRKSRPAPFLVCSRSGHRGTESAPCRC